ncbi:MAG: efflux RND transporter periplasmic adaptor subunit [Chitinophagaceae bacterium]|nr:efflux RND transporter periplasmic adaptor subunit [Chitinophagaceae bacterium]
MKQIITTLTSIILLASCHSSAEQKKKNIPTDNVPVKLMELNAGSSSNTIQLSGLLSTENQSELGFKIGGIIESVKVKEGDFVKKGSLLATLQLTEINTQVQQAKLGLEKAERDFQRAEHLYHDSVATLEQFQNAKTALEVSKQQFANANFNKQYASIYAPADGIVAKKLGSEGEIIAPGSPVLLLTETGAGNRWILKAGVSDRHWAALKIGDKAAINLDATPTLTLEGVVSKKAPFADPVSGTFPIEILVNIQKIQPAIGMFAKASIQVTAKNSSYQIPYSALLEANGMEASVFVTNDMKTAQRVTIKLESIKDNFAQVSEGLAGYKYLIVSGSPYLTDNSKITVTQ